MFTAAKREYRARKEPNFDAACFHAQQCTEKYLKACLHELGIPFERTHNLVHLLNLILPSRPLWEGMRTSLVVLNNYAVVFRYPGEFADRETARDAIAICKDLREQARISMCL
ncbi:MAG: HEPN domain-containing protein [Verrucomicrobia bacterium]|nr:HEPN domain-containing protein [Verrucomicrobiota bacterium]